MEKIYFINLIANIFLILLTLIAVDIFFLLKIIRIELFLYYAILAISIIIFIIYFKDKPSITSACLIIAFIIDHIKKDYNKKRCYNLLLFLYSIIIIINSIFIFINNNIKLIPCTLFFILTFFLFSIEREKELNKPV